MAQQLAPGAVAASGPPTSRLAQPLQRRMAAEHRSHRLQRLCASPPSRGMASLRQHHAVVPPPAAAAAGGKCPKETSVATVSFIISSMPMKGSMPRPFALLVSNAIGTGTSARPRASVRLVGWMRQCMQGQRCCHQQRQRARRTRHTRHTARARTHRLPAPWAAARLAVCPRGRARGRRTRSTARRGYVGPPTPSRGRASGRGRRRGRPPTSCRLQGRGDRRMQGAGGWVGGRPFEHKRRRNLEPLALLSDAPHRHPPASTFVLLPLRYERTTSDEALREGWSMGPCSVWWQRRRTGTGNRHATRYTQPAPVSPLSPHQPASQPASSSLTATMHGFIVARRKVHAAPRDLT